MKHAGLIQQSRRDVASKEDDGKIDTNTVVPCPTCNASCRPFRTKTLTMRGKSGKVTHYAATCSKCGERYTFDYTV